MYSKLDCNLPVPATVTAEPLSLRLSPPCTLSFSSVPPLPLRSLFPFTSLPPFPHLSSASCPHVGVWKACHQNARISLCAFVAVIDGTEQLYCNSSHGKKDSNCVRIQSRDRSSLSAVKALTLTCSFNFGSYIFSFIQIWIIL